MAKRKTKHPPGTLIVGNPRGFPKGTWIIRDVAGGVEVGRWFEGDVYDGEKVEHWLERGFVVRVDGRETEVSDGTGN